MDPLETFEFIRSMENDHEDRAHALQDFAAWLARGEENPETVGRCVPFSREEGPYENEPLDSRPLILAVNNALMFGDLSGLAKCGYTVVESEEEEDEPDPLPVAYTVKIRNERDQLTLEWLRDHGYDAGFLDLATFRGRDDKGNFVYTFTEPQAWEFRDEIEEDPSAFLACNGSDTLNSSLLEFEDSIV